MTPRVHYPIGSISSGTMRPEDLIPAFCSELEYQAKRAGIVPAKRRREHLKLVREIEHSDGIVDFEDEWLTELFDALEEYAGPYFYFGAHPDDGADYGWWLSEGWDQDFASVVDGEARSYTRRLVPFERDNYPESIKVNDRADVPNWFRGEVAVINDHGNVTLYVKTSRTLREIWSIV
jgi:hypothetical protein